MTFLSVLCFQRPLDPAGIRNGAPFFLFLYAVYYAAIRIDTEAYQLPFPQEITQAL